MSERNYPGKAGVYLISFLLNEIKTDLSVI